MNAPPARCRHCGWFGPAPGFHITESTGISFEGSAVTCPRCGQMAEIISGTYDFIGGVVRLVRDSNLSLSELREIRRAAAAARDSGQTPDVFVATNPAAAPIINLLIQQGKGRDWLVVFLMVLTIVISYMQNAEYHTDDERQAAKAPQAVTTQMLTTRDLTQIEQRIERRLAGDTPAKNIRRLPTTSTRQPKRKKPKHYG